ncbi:arsenic resistance N-acetyltransferase ArsN2 [Mucilaginibacter sp. UR6-1]|uniref:arsenic resistance N-acetyltransferase ArsN2 n=1 Tax=Mucilaginibacter sp. UR6-1 TaxID=1435643 RepID=UPI001E3FDBB1|nr:arsenic resistance N-acetyltransferase ArsN2 [Mucilaginibacter sp. UR6-1]MCC8408508.1 arsenic resistance N-acetyltransferase ArsN2 [Mucilaginibacter sp. UR6-1]
MITQSAISHKQQVVNLLQAQHLPYADLPQDLNNFFVVTGAEQLIGVAGFEVYEGYALLRSVAVLPEYRGKGIAATLLSIINTRAVSIGVKELWLFTESAAGYFERLGFTQTSRGQVPAPLRLSTQYSSVCPQSAAVMFKSIQ